MTEFVFAAGQAWTPVFAAIVGLVVGAPATFFGVKAYRRAEKLDEVAAEVAVATAGDAAIQRAFDAFDRIVANQRTDNEEGRRLVAELRAELRACRSAYDDLKRLLPNHT